MKVNFGQQVNIKQKPDYIKSALKGAIASSAVYSGLTTASSIAQPDMFKKVVEEVGGRKEYSKTYAVALGVIALGGAVLSTLITSIASKVKPDENPKAN